MTRTIQELIEILHSSNADDQMVEIFEDDALDVIYYLQQYQNLLKMWNNKLNKEKI